MDYLHRRSCFSPLHSREAHLNHLNRGEAALNSAAGTKSCQGLTA